MRITAELAQPIVDRAVAILGRNINIMDEDGTIVGSGDPERVGSFHQGAAMVIQTGRVQEITAEEVPRLAGAREGVNLPIASGQRIVGVIGITGPPREVRPYGELLREMAQLMLAQARAAELERAAALAREALLRDLLTGSGALSGRMEREASLLDLVPHRPYQVLLCELAGGTRPEDLPALSGSVQAAAHGAGADPVIITGPWEGRLVVVAGNPPKRLTALLQKGLPEGAAVAGGLVRQGPEGLPESYQTAREALQAGRALYGPGGYEADHLELEMVLTAIDPARARGFVARTLSGLPPASAPQGQQARQTIRAYLAEGMSRTRTAERLGIHRHTLIYRLEQIAGATGLDPRHWEAGLRLSVALLLETLIRQRGE